MSSNDPNTVIANSRRLASPSSLLFPNDAEIGSTRFLISFSTYKGVLSGSKIDPTSSRKYSTHKITLPIPQGLDNNFQMNFDQVELGLSGGIAQKLLTGSKSFQDITARVNADTFAGLGTQIGFGVERAAAELAFDAAGNRGNGAAILNNAIGAVKNPNLATTFQGVNLRAHSFSWRFAPKSAAESANLRKIITTLKRSALPSRNQNQNYILLYPDTATITISGSSNKMIDFSKTGLFVKDVGVKYDGVAAAFYKGTGEPVITDLTLSFIDRSIVTREDVS